MIAQIGCADADAQIAGADVITVCPEQLLQQGFPGFGTHPDDVLGAAAGERKAKAVHLLQTMGIVDLYDGSCGGIAFFEGKFAWLLGKKDVVNRIRQPDTDWFFFLCKNVESRGAAKDRAEQGYPGNREHYLIISVAIECGKLSV